MIDGFVDKFPRDQTQLIQSNSRLAVNEKVKSTLAQYGLHGHVSSMTQRAHPFVDSYGLELGRSLTPDLLQRCNPVANWHTYVYLYTRVVSFGNDRTKIR
jgi:hypothetical protein